MGLTTPLSHAHHNLQSRSPSFEFAGVSKATVDRNIFFLISKEIFLFFFMYRYSAIYSVQTTRQAYSDHEQMRAWRGDNTHLFSVPNTDEIVDGKFLVPSSPHVSAGSFVNSSKGVQGARPTLTINTIDSGVWNQSNNAATVPVFFAVDDITASDGDLELLFRYDFEGTKKKPYNLEYLIPASILRAWLPGKVPLLDRHENDTYVDQYVRVDLLYALLEDLFKGLRPSC